MALLLYSNKCTHSADTLAFINSHSQLKQIIQLHNVNTQGIPRQYAGKITRVPTLLTKNGKMLVGSEVKQWLVSLLPVEELTTCNIQGKCGGFASLDGHDDDSFFDLDHYGQSLQPAMTPEIQAKINKSVTADTYDLKT